MHRAFHLLAAVIVASNGVTAFADDPIERPSHERDARTIAPLLDDATFLVLRVDVDRLDLEAAMRWLDAVTSDEPPHELKAAVEPLLPLHRLLDESGIGQVYVLLSMLHLDAAGWRPAPIVAMPISDEQAVRDIKPLWDALGSVFTPEWERYAVRSMHGLLVIAPPRALDHFEGRNGASRPELSRAFELAGPAPVNVALMVPEYFRRAVDQVQPELPEDFGGGPSRVLTDGVRMMGLGVELPPQPRLEWQVQSADAAAAAALQKWLVEYQNEVLAMLEEEAAQWAQEFFERAGPHRRGERLAFELDAKVMEQQVVPMLLDAIKVRWAEREHRARMLVFMRLKTLADAIRDHVETHGDWPERLEELLHDAGEAAAGDGPAVDDPVSLEKLLEDARARGRVHPATLRNPHLPDADPGYIYLKPRNPQRAADSLDVIILHPAYETWPEDGILAATAAGVVIHVSTQEQLQRRLEASVEAGGGRP